MSVKVTLAGFFREQVSEQGPDAWQPSTPYRIRDGQIPAEAWRPVELHPDETLDLWPGIVLLACVNESPHGKHWMPRRELVEAGVTITPLAGKSWVKITTTQAVLMLKQGLEIGEIK